VALLDSFAAGYLGAAIVLNVTMGKNMLPLFPPRSGSPDTSRRADLPPGKRRNPSAGQNADGRPQGLPGTRRKACQEVAW
jgi:hypothetical protein